MRGRGEEGGCAGRVTVMGCRMRDSEEDRMGGGAIWRGFKEGGRRRGAWGGGKGERDGQMDFEVGQCECGTRLCQSLAGAGVNDVGMRGGAGTLGLGTEYDLKRRSGDRVPRSGTLGGCGCCGGVAGLDCYGRGGLLLGWAGGAGSILTRNGACKVESGAIRVGMQGRGGNVVAGWRWSVGGLAGRQRGGGGKRCAWASAVYVSERRMGELCKMQNFALVNTGSGL